jgi:hypothetical protein
MITKNCGRYSSPPKVFVIMVKDGAGSLRVKVIADFNVIG